MDTNVQQTDCKMTSQRINVVTTRSGWIVHPLMILKFILWELEAADVCIEFILYANKSVQPVIKARKLLNKKKKH